MKYKVKPAYAFHECKKYKILDIFRQRSAPLLYDLKLYTVLGYICMYIFSKFYNFSVFLQY